MKKLLIFLLLGMFLINLVSAVNFDNYINYKNNNLKIEVRDSYFYVDQILNFGNKIADIEITSHKSVDEILYVNTGWNEVLRIKGNSKQEYKNFIQENEFTNVADGEKRDVLYYWEKAVAYEETEKQNPKIEVCGKDVYSAVNNTWAKNCWLENNGTYKEVVVAKWEKVDINNVEKGDFEIRLIVYVKKGDLIDVKPTLFGKKINKWVIYGNPVVDNLGIDLTNTYSDSTKTGQLIITNKQVLLKNVTKDSDCTATTFYLYTYHPTNPSLATLINQSSFSGNVAKVDSLLQSGTPYWLIANKNGDSYTIARMLSGNPVAGTNINYTANYTDDFASVGTNGRPYIFVSVTTETAISEVTINITYPFPTTYSTITHDLNYTYSITGGGTADSCWYSLNKGQTNSSRQNCGLNWTGLTASEGANTWTVYGNLTTGEMGNTTRDFSVDTTLIVSITFPTAITYNTNTLDLNYTYSTDGTLDSCWYSLNKGQTNSSRQNCGLNWTGLTASEGANTWTVYGNLTTGKMGNSTVTFTTNTTPMIEFSGDTPNNYVNQTYNSLFVNVTLTETYYNNITFNLYNNSYYNINSTIFTDGTRQINWTTAYDGDYTYNATMWTTTNLYNSTLTRHIKIDSVAPTINITNPLNGSVYTTGTAIENNITIILNWTAVDPTLQNCWVFNGTANNSVTCGNNGTYINILYGNHTFYFYANDSVGHLSTAVISAHWIYNFLENSVTYNTTTFETSKESFILNMSSNINILAISSSMVYNGTSYPSTSTCTSGVCIILNSLDIPIITTIPNQANNFSWIINIFNGSTSINVNSSSHIQNISRIYMTACNASNTLEVANFTNYEEENRTRIHNFDFSGTFSYWTGDGSIKKNETISNTFVNESRLCVSNESILYHSDAIMQYKPSTNTSGLSYIQRGYYFINTSLNNTSSKKVELYSLLSSDSTSFILEVYDNAQLPIKNAYLYLQKYYEGENIFKTIEMTKTDSTGSSIGHFKAEVEDYRIIIEKDNEIIYQGGTQKIVCKETPCTITLQTSSITGVTWEDFGSIANFEYTLSFNNATNLWTFQYIDNSGSIGYGRLYVYTRHPVLGEQMICNATSPLLAATLICDASGNNGTIYANAYLSRSPEILVFSKTSLISTLKRIFALEGLFLSMFILMMLGLAGLWNPAVGIILEVAGVIIINLLGIASFGMTAIWGIIFIAGIILWELKT